MQPARRKPSHVSSSTRSRSAVLWKVSRKPLNTTCSVDGFSLFAYSCRAATTSAALLLPVQMQSTSHNVERNGEVGSRKQCKTRASRFIMPNQKKLHAQSRRRAPPSANKARAIKKPMPMPTKADNPTPGMRTVMLPIPTCAGMHLAETSGGNSFSYSAGVNLFWVDMSAGKNEFANDSSTARLMFSARCAGDAGADNVIDTRDARA
mmetsp:Transcript_95237/g.269166  ORF Transcript_95237/g.269166 Transcript_95237/m.269166 type:complete len:207 (-) Transcript_95237:17-637(-)